MFHLPDSLAICVELLLPGIPLHSGEGILHPDQAFGFCNVSPAPSAYKIDKPEDSTRV